MKKSFIRRLSVSIIFCAFITQALAGDKTDTIFSINKIVNHNSNYIVIS